MRNTRSKVRGDPETRGETAPEPGVPGDERTPSGILRVGGARAGAARSVPPGRSADGEDQEHLLREQASLWSEEDPTVAPAGRLDSQPQARPAADARIRFGSDHFQAARSDNGLEAWSFGLSQPCEPELQGSHRQPGLGLGLYVYPNRRRLAVSVQCA